ncbi:MAG: class I SAM-dependent methyltransferase [Solirubrobacteraceae bacterium]
MGPLCGEDERGWWASRIWLPWIDRVKPLADSVVLEYGCGPGSVSRAVAPLVARHIGLDIDADHLSIARRLAASSEQDNSEFHCHPPEDIVDAFRAFAGQVDIVLLYAVLEHLTVDERLAVLRAARDVARPYGVIAVVELPNRLTAFDQHSTWLPFANQLPDDLALEYLRRATRPEFRDEVLSHRNPSLPASADEEALLALRRFGRGASFHEFELAWDARLADCVLASNWGPDVLAHREIDPGELALARTMRERRPDLDPCWSRQWIDTIIAPDPVVRREPVFWPWTGIAGPASEKVAYNSPDIVFVGRGAALHVELPEPTRRVALRIVDGEEATSVLVETLTGGTVEQHAVGRPGHAVTVTLDLPEWSDDLLVRLPNGGWILVVLFLGYGG